MHSINLMISDIINVHSKSFFLDKLSKVNKDIRTFPLNS